MTQVDDSLILTEPTSGFFTGTVNTEDRPIIPTMTGLDRMEIIFDIILLIFSTSSKQLL